MALGLLCFFWGGGSFAYGGHHFPNPELWIIEIVNARSVDMWTHLYRFSHFVYSFPPMVLTLSSRLDWMQLNRGFFAFEMSLMLIF